MTLFTLVTNLKNIYKQTALTYLGISILCFIFPIIYEQFAYGQSSIWMRTMGVPPLIGGFIFFGSLWLSAKPIMNYHWARRLWHSAMAVFVSGGLVTGIIEVSGRSTNYERLYGLIGGILLLTSIGLAISTQSDSRTETQQGPDSTQTNQSSI